MFSEALPSLEFLSVDRVPVDAVTTVAEDGTYCVVDSSLWTISGAVSTPTVHRRDQSNTTYACATRGMIIGEFAREGDGPSHVSYSSRMMCRAMCRFAGADDLTDERLFGEHL